MSHRACVNLQPVEKVLDTLYTVPYFGLTGLLMILCGWSPVFLLSKLLALQDNAQNLEEQQLWVKGRREVSIILHRSVTSRFEVKKAGFSLECLNIFATGCSSNNIDVFVFKTSFLSVHMLTSGQRFQNSSLWIAFLKRCILVTIFTKYIWTVGQTRGKISIFKQKWIRVDGDWVYKLWPLINMQGVH